jgi:hypothetical protein
MAFFVVPVLKSVIVPPSVELFAIAVISLYIIVSAV